MFSIAGIPVSVSPFYLLLLLMFSRGDLVRGLIWAVGITIALLVHELGHALVALYLRHQPSITLEGMGGSTSRVRQGRDVEEAAIIAMGPAAGLALGLLIAGIFQLLLHVAGGRLLMSATVFEAFHALLYPCIAWNLLNLLPMWPLDGGQLFRLGAMRLFGARRADRLTHGLALTLIALALLWALSAQSWFLAIVLATLAGQNVSALRGQTSSGVVHTATTHARELVNEAQQALADGRYKEAARLAQQARAGSNVPLPLLDEIWQVLGLATAAQGEHEEALTYLRRAAPNERVKRATSECLAALGEEEAMPEVEARWQSGARGRYMNRVLIAALSFIVLSAGIVFTTSLSDFVF